MSPWDQEGEPMVDDDYDEAVRDRAADLGIDGTSIQSALDRANLVWLIDAYAGEKLLLLARIATAAPAVCWLSTERLARDCKIHPRTAERYRAAFVADGILQRIVDAKGRTAFRIDW